MLTSHLIRKTVKSLLCFPLDTIGASWVIVSHHGSGIAKTGSEIQLFIKSKHVLIKLLWPGPKSQSWLLTNWSLVIDISVNCAPDMARSWQLNRDQSIGEQLGGAVGHWSLSPDISLITSLLANFSTGQFFSFLWILIYNLENWSTIPLLWRQCTWHGGFEASQETRSGL